MSLSWWRVMLVTLTMVVTEFVCGALVGALLLIGISLAYGDVPSVGSVEKMFVLSIVVGGPLGALAAPVVSWLLLRRVQIARAMVVTGASTVVGGVLAARIVGFFDLAEAAMFAAVPGGLVGFCLAALSLRLVHGRREAVRNAG